jgi:hypothetical protein
MRGVLLTLNAPWAAHWPARQRLVALLDPLSAWIWPSLRSKKALGLLPRLAQWIVRRSNPQARTILQLEGAPPENPELRKSPHKFDYENPETASPSYRSSLLFWFVLLGIGVALGFLLQFLFNDSRQLGFIPGYFNVAYGCFLGALLFKYLNKPRRHQITGYACSKLDEKRDCVLVTEITMQDGR